MSDFSHDLKNLSKLRNLENIVLIRIEFKLQKKFHKFPVDSLITLATN